MKSNSLGKDDLSGKISPSGLKRVKLTSPFVTSFRVGSPTLTIEVKLEPSNP